jgi:dipeptidyl aminopeptidase/acylaminoacyl peptidase
LGTPEGRGPYLGSLDGDAPKRLAATGFSSGAFLPPDWIIFQQQTALMAQRLDVKRGTLIGNPVRLAGIPSALGLSGVSASADGSVAYRAGGRDQVQLTWYDRSGKNLGSTVVPDAKPASYPELSRDGQRVAFTSIVEQNVDIWIQDLARGGLTTRFTFDPGNDTSPVWSPDGGRIAFISNRKGALALYVGPSNQPGGEQVLLERDCSPNDWSKDGRFLLCREIDPKTSRDLWALPLTGSDRKQFDIARTPANENNGQFSPDGRLVVYETDRSGRFEIVVQGFPEATDKLQVSTGGGTQPRWSADGKELYFIAPDGKLMAAPITSTGATFAAGTPTALFPAWLAPGGPANKQQYAVSREGQFLLYQQIEESAPITLILNWKPPAK